jgi:intergrase/recombinase
MLYCRKIFATYLRLEGIEQEIIDLLQGRIPRNVFVRHYFRPSFARENEKVRNALENMFEKIRMVNPVSYLA